MLVLILGSVEGSNGSIWHGEGPGFKRIRVHGSYNYPLTLFS